MVTLTEQIEDTDLDIFIDASNGFAEDVVFKGTFGPWTISGIFNASAPVMNDYTAEGAADTSALTVRTKHLKEVKPHDTITIGLATYEILTITPNGKGLTRLTLNKIRED